LLRITSAALLFLAWRRPWRVLRRATTAQRQVFAGLAVVLAAMNSLFYLAIDRLPLATVGAIEFLGTVLLAALGVRTVRNVLALGLAVGGVFLLTDVRVAGEPLGFVFAFANCVGFIRIASAAPAFTHPLWLMWGIGVGVCSSVIPYVTDQFAMARLPRPTFALMLALLPAAATVIGLLMLAQTPTGQELIGIALVIIGVALHRDKAVGATAHAS
jgi:inner membrane transporter RhtA